MPTRSSPPVAPPAPRVHRAVTEAVVLALTLLMLVLGGTAGHAATEDPAADDAAPVDDASVTWGVRTASGDLGADRQSYAYTVQPGGRVVDAIVVTNHDTAPLELDVYAADGFTTEAGQLDVATRDMTNQGVGAWVELATDHVMVEPGASLQVEFALTVPEDAEPGDRAGALVTSLTVPESQDGVTVDRRLGIRLHLRVAGDLVPGLVVEDLRVDDEGSLNPFAPGDATVTYTVHNTGNVRLSAGQEVSVAGPFGAARVHADDLASVPELLPGESWPVSVTLEGVWPLVRLGAAVTLAPLLPADAVEQRGIPPVQAAAGTWAVPWSVLVLLAVAVGAVLLIRQRVAGRRLAEEARVQEAVDRALRERDEQGGRDDEQEPDPSPESTAAPVVTPS